MSRCFPFPPPGYERKPITDDPDLLKKEKRREKKHKKDKEKKDGKEHKEKDRGEGKHKEKKDKKDKHRDKKRDKEKSKTSTPDDKNSHGQFEGYNGEILHHNNPSIQFPHQNGDLFKNRRMVGDTENFRFVQELDRRIRDEEKGTGSHQFVDEGRKNSVTKVGTQTRDGRQVVMDVAGFGGNVTVSRSNGVTPPLDNRRNEKIKEKGSDRRPGVMDVTGFGGHVVVPNRINGATPPLLGNTKIEKMLDKGSDDRRKDKDRDIQKQGRDKEIEKLKGKSEQKKTQRGKNENIMKNDLVDVANNLSTHPLENSIQSAGYEGNLKKRKAMETNGIYRENEPRPNKIARPISNISPENGRKPDFLQSPSPSLLDKRGASPGTPLNSFNNAGSKGGKGVNGMILSQPTSVSAKKPPSPGFNHLTSKPSPVKSPPVITNHVSAQPLPATKPLPNHFAAQPPIPKPPPSIPNPITAHHHLPPLSSPPPPPPPQPPSTSVKQPIPRPKPPPAVVNKVAPSAPAPSPSAPVPSPAPLPIPKKKPPHPDTKYLNQILSVPKLEPWCGLDDQEWLHSSKAGTASRKAPTNKPEVQVWSEAKHIESVDVCALPYVIPY